MNSTDGLSSNQTAADQGRRLPGSLRALLLLATMPALSAVNAGVGLLLPALLGPAEFGQYAIAVTLFQYGLILDLGLSQLLDRRLPVMHAAGEVAALQHFANQVLWVRIYVATAATIGGTALLGILSAAGRLPFPMLPGLLSLVGGLLFMVALGPMVVWRGTSRRAEFARWSGICGIVLAVGRPLGMVLGGLSGCFAGLVAGYALVAMRVQAKMPMSVTDRPGPRFAAALLAKGAPLFATSFVWAFYMTANRWVVSFLAPKVELGQFAFGANIVYLIVGTIGALSQFHYPAMVGQSAARGDFAVSRVLTRDLCALAAAIALPIAVAIAIGPMLIGIVYPSFAGAEVPVRGLLTAVPALVVASWLMPLSLSTAARPWIEGAITYPVALVLLVAATWAGFRWNGIDGAAWGLVSSAIPLVMLQLINLRAIRLLTTGSVLWIQLVTLSLTALLIALALLF